MDDIEKMNTSLTSVSKSDDSDSDTSSSIAEDETSEKEIAANITFFKKQIEENCLNYEAHLGLIQALRKSGELEELRKARQAMNKIYPLSSELWMDWVSDEQKICSSEEERSFVISLFKKGVQEYMSVQLWVEYIMFMLGGGKMEDTRKVCEEALMAVGIHFAEGLLVWQAVILVEQQHFLSLQQDDKSKEKEEQMKRIQSLYKRQARVPLMNLDKTEFLTDAARWFNGQVNSQLKRDLDNSFKKCADKLPFEKALLQANDETEKLEAYRKYIDFVLKTANPVVIQNVYERTVRDLCLNAGIWEEYVRFTMEQFSSAHYVILPVCKRSLFNCPWSSSLFELQITALQMFSEVIGQEEVKETIKDSLEKTLGSGVSNEIEIIKIWMAYLVYLRRKVIWGEESTKSHLAAFREGCDRSISFIEERLGIEGDRECTIARFRARIEAESAKNMEGARTIWNDHVMKRNNNFKVAALWLEFINLERSYGDEKHCRKLYRRAMERVWEQVEAIGTSFLQFEQELGSLETMMDFQRRYRDRLSIVQKKRMEDLMKEVNQKKIEHDGKAKGRRREETTVQKATPKVSPTKLKKIPEQKMDIDASSTGISKGQKRTISEVEVSPPPGYKPNVASPDEKSGKKQKVNDQHGEHVEHDSSLDYRTVFLSNMDYNAKEEDVVAVFADCGPVESFRTAKDFKGRSKGFGYLVFKGPGSIPDALKKDRTPVGTRPLFVSECKPKSRETVFRFSTGLEKEKLFVRGLPFSMNEEDIRTTFLPHGDIKSLRLVTHRNGFSKGTCYIEYHDAATAEKVQKQMDGVILKDKTITVVISNPTGNKSKPESTSRPTRQSASVPSTSGTRPRDKLSFVPRSLVRRPVTSESGNGEAPSTQKENGIPNGTSHTTPKSNDDFRKLFLK